ncbi:PEGA domain-containing protein [candidate division WWE3 bacterium]|uniref:PEGA domain-containing protein n=1 Tax=candidate division WWE3 bacterium TaxID=2053526 RepID=A0A955LK39_UNCKA|nr:PEGA domain-containing protein [candidate division WWE3 bacterium]
MKIRYTLYFLSTVALISALAVVVLLLASGYRFDFKTGTIRGTGIVSVSSTPDGALVYVNGTPQDATNTSIINLDPGTYSMRIEKEGFSPWSMDVKVKAELVTKVDALLIPLYPTLQPLTFTGVTNPTLSPNGQKIVYTVTQGKNAGVWLINLEEGPFNIARKPELIVANDETINYQDATYAWSPTGEEVLISIPTGEETTTYQLANLATNTVVDVKEVETVYSTWDDLALSQNTELLATLSEEVVGEINGLNDLAWSPSGDYILNSNQNDDNTDYFVYTVKRESSQNNQPTPTITIPSDEAIVSIPTSTPHTVQWYPDSRHLVITSNKDDNTQVVEIVEITGTNRTQIFSGLVKDLQSFPNLNGSKIIILTRFNPESEGYNLYSVNLR